MSANYISKVIKPANFHLRNIGKIRKFLNIDYNKSAIVSLVTSRIDYCNGIICGITHEPRCRLQKVHKVPLEWDLASKSMTTLHKLYKVFTGCQSRK